MTRLFLIFHGRFPSEKAASLFTAKGAEAFARAGVRVTVVAPERRGVTRNDPFEFYDIKKNFDVVYLPVIDFFDFLPNKASFLISFIAFSISSFFYIKEKSAQEDVIYSNETLPLLLISRIRENCFFELHDFPQSKLWLFSKLLSRMRWVLVHNRWKLAEIDRKFPEISSHKFLYEPNAVDVAAFDIPLSSNEARRRLDLPTDKVLAVYTGHLYSWKGVDTLAQAAEHLTEHFVLVFVGGTQNDVAEFRKKYGRSRKIMITGHMPHKDIPIWQKAADVLVLPNTGKVRISTHYTSPMKLYEYMASRRPIIASSIPSILEIVDHESAVLVEPDEPKLLADAIDSLVRDKERGERLAKTAYEDVLEHTWDKRAERILNFIRKGQIE